MVKFAAFPTWLVPAALEYHTYELAPEAVSVAVVAQLVDTLEAEGCCTFGAAVTGMICEAHAPAPA